MADALAFDGLLDGGWRRCAFEPFSPGVEVSWLLTGEPAVALLRYQPGAAVRRHRHTGLESILVLEGSQCDENGCHEAGSYVLNCKNSVHSVWSPTGCVVLIQWEKPVAFLNEDGTGDLKTNE